MAFSCFSSLCGALYSQPSFPSLLTMTCVVCNVIDASGIVLTLIMLTLIYVFATVVSLKTCTAVTHI